MINREKEGQNSFSESRFGIMGHFAFITHNSSKENSHMLLSTAIGNYEFPRKKGYSLKKRISLPSVEVVNRSAILLLIIPIVIIDDFEQ